MTTRRQSGHLKKAFLEAYRETGNIRSACTAAGVGRSTIYKWQEHDGAFHAAFGQAQVEAVEALEAEAYRRGVEGVEEPIYAPGRGVVGTVRKYSDTLLIFLLKGAAPAKYRERYEPAPTAERDRVVIGYEDGAADDRAADYPTS